MMPIALIEATSCSSIAGGAGVRRGLFGWLERARIGGSITLSGQVGFELSHFGRAVVELAVQRKRLPETSLVAGEPRGCVMLAADLFVALRFKALRARVRGGDQTHRRLIGSIASS